MSTPSYFQRAANYYILNISLAGRRNFEALIQACKRKYARGVNLVYVEADKIGVTFTPNFLVDPGRIFLTYERLVEEVNGIDQETLDGVRRCIDQYDPDSQLVFLVVPGNVCGELCLYTVNKPE
jgi:hypothetical protein